MSTQALENLSVNVGQHLVRKLNWKFQIPTLDMKQDLTYSKSLTCTIGENDAEALFIVLSQSSIV